MEVSRSDRGVDSTTTAIFVASGIVRPTDVLVAGSRAELAQPCVAPAGANGQEVRLSCCGVESSLRPGAESRDCWSESGMAIPGIGSAMVVNSAEFLPIAGEEASHVAAHTLSTRESVMVKTRTNPAIRRMRWLMTRFDFSRLNAV